MKTNPSNARWAAALAVATAFLACDNSKTEMRSERGLGGSALPEEKSGDAEQAGATTEATPSVKGTTPGSGTTTETPTSVGGRPAVLLTSAHKSPTNAAPIRVSALFSEEVIGLDAGDFYVENGRVISFDTDPLNPLRYDLAVAPADDGDVAVQLLENTVQARNGKGNLTSPPSTFAYDGTAPKPVVSTSAVVNPGGVSLVSPIPVMVTFSEPVPAITKDKVAIEGGAVTFFEIESSKVVKLEVTPEVTGPIRISLAQGVTADAAGNKSAASNTLEVKYAGAPAVTVTTAVKSPTNRAPVPVVVTFTEAVTGFDLGDLTVTSATASNLATNDNRRFTVEITPTVLGASISVSVAAGAARSVAGNVANKAATPLVFAFDSVAPGVSLSSTISGSTYLNPIAVRATFSEPVSGFVKEDIVVSNGTISAFTDAGNGVYDFKITPAAEGTVQAEILAAIATDAAGNANTASPERYMVTYTKINYTNQILPIVSVKCAPCHSAAGGQAGKYAENDKAVWDNALTAIKARVGNDTMPPGGLPAGEKELILNYVP